jgi:hypothetical protein
MAKIHEEILIIKLSKLVKENDQTTPISSEELVASLAAVAEELAGAGVIVEVESA